MPTTQKIRNVLILIDYVPAELRENKTWKIVYYVKCPIDNKLKRKQNRVKPLKSVTERRKLARKMVLQINKKLEKGWNPLLTDNEARSFVKFSDAARLFLDRTTKEVNNVVYVQWIQDISTKHWNDLTKNNPDINFVWVVTRHEIDYKKQALLGDAITFRTWVGATKGVTSVRHVEIFKDDVLLVKATTIWCMLHAKTLKPARITESVLNVLEAGK